MQIRSARLALRFFHFNLKQVPENIHAMQVCADSDRWGAYQVAALRQRQLSSNPN